MAGGNVCRFYLKGECTYGSRCKFLHPNNASTQQQGQGRGDGKNVCKFFMDGKCRFGDRCKFYHPKHDQGAQRGNSYQPPPVDTGRNWNQRGGGRNRFELYTNHDSTDGGGGGGRGYEQRRGGYSNSQQRDSWSHRDNRSQGYRGRDSTDGRSADHWQHQQGQRGGWEDRGASQGGRQRLFSQDDSKTPHHLTDPSEIADVIRRDVESNRNNMWPLSCYSYHKEAACVPGLIEVSPEELRLLAYMAKSSGNTATFQKNLEEVGKKQAAILDMYATITTDEVRKLLSLPPQTSGCDWSSGLGPINTTVCDAAASSLFGARTTGPLFSGSSNSLFSGGTDPPLFSGGPSPQPFQGTGSTQASSIFSSSPVKQMSMTLAMTPAPSVTAPSPQSAVTAQNPPTQGSTANKLTQEELEAFKADKFELGKIPETAPPPDLC